MTLDAADYVLEVALGPIPVPRRFPGANNFRKRDNDLLEGVELSLRLWE